MRLRRRFEWFPDDAPEPEHSQVYRFEWSPKRGSLTVIMATVAAFTVLPGVTLGGLYFVTKPTKATVIKLAPTPAPEPIRRRQIYEPPRYLMPYQGQNR